MNQISQYPVAIMVSAQVNGGESVSWEGIMNKHSEKNVKGVAPIAKYAQTLQEQITADQQVILPVIASYDTQRQWSNTGDKPAREIRFIPRMNGYADALSAEPFNIGAMRHWFSRMLLISRKKNVPEFEAVRNAVASCYKHVDDDQSVKRVVIDYDAEKEDLEFQTYFDDGSAEVLPLYYLSDGTKSILAVAADIAYRMAVLNPGLLDRVITDTDGVVMIDEVDMHLHPSWQRKIVNSLHETFPKVQFIFTTHSPSVLTNVPKENIVMLHGRQAYNPEANTYGRDVNSVLREVMHTEIRPSEISGKLKAFSDAVSDSDLDSADKILKELRRVLGDNDSEVVSAQVTLDLERI